MSSCTMNMLNKLLVETCSHAIGRESETHHHFLRKAWIVRRPYQHSSQGYIIPEIEPATMGIQQARVLKQRLLNDDQFEDESCSSK